jgi:hypothetical protein
MAVKVRLFLDGQLVEPSQLVINNVTINRIVNSIVENTEATCQGKTEEVA